MRLKGKVALISGSARGIGRDIAMLMAQEGAKIAIGDIMEEGLSTAREINKAGGDAIFSLLDVTQEGDWKRAVESTVDKFGKLDVLVNNAGIFQMASVEDTSADLWRRTMDVNVTGVFLGTRSVIPEMRRCGGGSIVNISSIGGLTGAPKMSAYQASKGAVRIFTKATAIECARDLIRANSVHPGPIETDMLSPVLEDPDFFGDGFSLVPLGRLGKPRDIAFGVLYLASDESSYVTGSELVIDGGMMAH